MQQEVSEYKRMSEWNWQISMTSLQLLIDVTSQDVLLKPVLDSTYVFQSCNLLAAARGSSYNGLLEQ